VCSSDLVKWINVSKEVGIALGRSVMDTFRGHTIKLSGDYWPVYES
jgi:hypothetical protein